jgi:hypothetical protein
MLLAVQMSVVVMASVKMVKQKLSNVCFSSPIMGIILSILFYKHAPNYDYLIMVMLFSYTNERFENVKHNEK